MSVDPDLELQRGRMMEQGTTGGTWSELAAEKGWAKALTGTEISEEAYDQLLKLKKSENNQHIKFAI